MNMSEPEQFIAEGLRGKMRRNVPMCKHTSWRAGGTVQCMYQPAGLDDLLAFLRGLPADEPLVAVGLGSNLLVRDGGLRGTVLLLHRARSWHASPLCTTCTARNFLPVFPARWAACWR